MRNFLRSLSFRVVVPIVVVTVAFLSLHVYLLQVQEKAVFNLLLRDCAQRGARLLIHSMRHAMLLNRRQDIQEMVQDAARSPGVYGIRIFNKGGVVTYSDDVDELGRRVDLRAEACADCHAQGGQLRVPDHGLAVRFFTTPERRHIMGMTMGIDNEPACYNAACHAHPADQQVLGILDLRLDRTELDLLLTRHTRQALAAGIAVALLAALLGGLIVNLNVHSPIQRLIRGTREIAAGNLGYTIPIGGSSEIVLLAQSFNQMSRDLKRATDALKEWSQTLEDRIREKTEELERAQAQMIQAERMASLGKMAASVAHELNNPMSGILGLAKYVRRRLDRLDVEPELKAEMSRDLEVIENEAKRCGNIVKNLLLFAREGREGFSPVDLNDVLSRALVLVSHHLELSGVRLESELAPGGCHVVGNADELKQAFLALLINAVEAMPDGGTLRVRTEATEGDGKVRVEITDTGVGIPDDVLPHIFEPFFTTKRGGEALGLGLAVVYGIVQKHQGRIDVKTKVGEGTTFTIELPACRERPVPAEAGNQNPESERR
ncbi:MAG: ATP-binding protein [candidate division KSB1 bacterium]|nr:ATP-binding protein [candidate division KSB1 bacterium]